jgi:pheromone shutdown protein TraB
MSSTLLNVAREHSSVVAVVGKGHVSGIKKNWQQPIEVRFFSTKTFHVLYFVQRRNPLASFRLLSCLFCAQFSC